MWLLVVERGDVGLLALSPGRFRLDPAVGTILDDLRNGIAVQMADQVQRRPAAAVLRRIVQQSADRRILVATVFQHDPAHGEEVRHIGNGGALAYLRPVQARREGKRLVEAEAEFAHTRNTFITSSPKWLITFTAIRPVLGRANGREVSE